MRNKEDSRLQHPHHLPVEYEIVCFAVLCSLLFAYSLAAIRSGRRFRKWPIRRHLCWGLGLLGAGLGAAGPVGKRALTDFTAHMAGHLLLGMQAPLFLALGAPVTLMLRTLPRKTARLLSRFFRSRPVRLIGDPFAASVLHIGGLWLLYNTELYAAMQRDPALHGLIQLHVFLAGYLYANAILGASPVSRHLSFRYRAVALIAASAGHGILAKHIYAFPPAGVSASQAESGAVLMYYGGDVVDIAMIVLLCLGRFAASRPAVPTYREPPRSRVNRVH